MPLVLVRVDCRLIHGQVLEAWVPYTHADCVIVANDEAAEDLIQRSIMEMAAPPTIEVSIMKVSEAVDQIRTGRWAKKRVLLLFADCQDVLESMRRGLNIDRLNLGNMVCEDKKHQITCSLSLGQEDLACLNAIQQGGVDLDVRPVPHESPADISSFLNACQPG